MTTLLTVIYWGQNSYGAANGSDVSGWQQPLKFYCDDDAIDVLPIAFLTHFFGVGGEPQINLANYCNSVDNTTFPGTGLANCQDIAPEIDYCQSKGKLITLSLGGATGSAGFQSEEQALAFADTLWNLFFGGISSTRPFGDAILDGVDLDIEGGSPSYYVNFLTRLNSYFSAAKKKYYVTAAPQCVYPDASLQQTLNAYPFDAVYVQFYNNPCGLQNYNSVSQWNFGIWDIWARTISPNKNVKIYIGAPASGSAAGGGYVSASTLANIAVAMRDSFPSFGGVMFWDASQAYKNNRIDASLKAALKPGKKCDGSFIYPTCTAPAFVFGNSYPGGSTVSYDGYMWTAKWYATQAPSGSFNSDWSPVSSCAGGTLGGGDNNNSISFVTTKASATTIATSMTSASISEITTTTVTTLSSTTKVITTTEAASTTPVNACSDTAAWSSSATYVKDNQVTYSGSIWTAKWWTVNDIPGGPADVWVKGVICPVAFAARSMQNPIGTGINCKYNSRWTGSRTYKNGSKVVYRGSVYIATSPNMNASPENNSLVWTKDIICSKQLSI
ncbi:glycoside hydrolase superfamily [Parasitella parasitica]|nr:glycoside hydrolase superfamily [Parasitella parasitica]